MVTAMKAAPPRAILRRLRRPLGRRFGADQSGVSAVEFALILPIMLTLYFGAVELGDALTIKRKVTSVTSSLTDLVTQSKSVTDDDMKNILNAAKTMISPYDDSKLKIKITGVKIDDKGKATVAWSDALNDTAFAKNSPITLPANVSEEDSFLVTTEVHYDYLPTIGYVMTGSFDLNDQYYLRPRLSREVKRPSN
ncbi:TadE/TadG family type IV pilus assembly protein [Bauldia litoralis]|uniref:Flp pilus assembly protein TadG n=1 Tax=Bauldia litoralis TaxID=665467 RepID=A0A1G6EFG7_9HYPH|nr:TadE/TadG family type IV pilus assembly protein [Bauldia litoralis]SDB56174.1 Flp pilus assembly protein TadG [Bauldia litoralis]